jgi:hypothetical protein
VIKQSGASDAYVEPLLDEPEFGVVYLAVPDLTAIVDDAHLAHEIIHLKELDHFALQIKVVEMLLFFAVFFLHDD